MLRFYEVQNVWKRGYRSGRLRFDSRRSNRFLTHLRASHFWDREGGLLASPQARRRFLARAATLALAAALLYVVVDSVHALRFF